MRGVAEWIGKELGRLDILVSNAGGNITDRAWSRLSPAGVDELIANNLSSAFYCAQAVLPIMRAQGGGLMIHTASMAGRNIGPMSGPGYVAAKHGVVAMSHSINIEECGNGIRSCALLPGEVNTPILKKRPNPLSQEDLDADAPARGRGRHDPPHRRPAAACLRERDLAHADLEPRLRRAAGAQALACDRPGWTARGADRRLSPRTTPSPRR